MLIFVQNWNPHLITHNMQNGKTPAPTPSTPCKISQSLFNNLCELTNGFSVNLFLSERSENLSGSHCLTLFTGCTLHSILTPFALSEDPESSVCDSLHCWSALGDTPLRSTQGRGYCDAVVLHDKCRVTGRITCHTHCRLLTLSSLYFMSHSLQTANTIFTLLYVTLTDNTIFTHCARADNTIFTLLYITPYPLLHDAKYTLSGAWNLHLCSTATRRSSQQGLPHPEVCYTLLPWLQ